MISVKSVALINFRGAKRLTVAPERKSFVIQGANGTGKSGVVDAIEFALTGEISRLTGRGAGDLSIREHAAHVSAKDRPETSIVHLQVFSPKLGIEFTIERNVKTPREPKLSPDNEKTRALLKELEGHPEFALSRREILKYILTEPSKRSQQVQELLKLDAVEKVRASLQKVLNSNKSSLRKAELDTKSSKENFLRSLDLEELKIEKILEAANRDRSVLGLPALTEFTKDTSLKAGLVGAPGGIPKPKVNKSLATAELASVRKILGEVDSADLSKAIETAVGICGELESKPELLKNFQKQSFLKTGFQLIEDELCPFCDHEWDLNELRALVGRKVEDASAATRLKANLDTATREIAIACRRLADLARNLAGFLKVLDPTADVSVLSQWETELRGLPTQLATLDNTAASRDLLRSGWKRAPSNIAVLLSDFEVRFNALPDSSKEEEAKSRLTIAQERLEVHQKALRAEKLWSDRSDLVHKVVEKYNVSSNRVLSKIYEDVQGDFTRFYRTINGDDENAFTGKLTPTQGKLDFKVEFYGHGLHPPAAYHSEGHQDGMGLCLYLALMKRVLGESFTFTVLDDVLTSVDSGHRKEVCRLLKTEFPNTQFVVTTHEEVWMRHMLTEQLVTRKSVLEFRKWSVETGPVVWDHKDVWGEVAADLDMGNVPGASHTLRRYLEYVSEDLCDRIRAPLEYSSSKTYDLGQLMPAAASSFGAVLSRAKEAAHSWKQNDKFSQLKDRHDQFKNKLEKTNAEKWVINPTVHYNKWASFRKEDFAPVVESFRELLGTLKCESCEVFYFLSGPKGHPDAFRCDCTSFTLKKNVSPAAPA